MTTAVGIQQEATLGLWVETIKRWALHFLCFVLPLASFVFLLSAPHAWFASLPWLLVVIASIALDMRSPREQRQPRAAMPGWPFDGVLYALFVLQIANVALLVRLVALHGFFTTDTLVGLLLVGINSGYSGDGGEIITGCTQVCTSYANLRRSSGKGR